jgi:DNA-binding NtrC family response regulator
VNCAAIPEALFESAMFGHRRGAFTDAHDSHVGLIERSGGGTLFLDEVGDIPVPQQAKLLRVLQESELTPVGATRAVKVDLRVVAATNRNLEAMVRCGEFREDLYYRINVVRLHMPELSERPGDIPALSEHLLAEIAREHGGASAGPAISPEALEALSRHRWQGNVRELRNVLERASIAARGRRIEVTDLPLAGGEGAPVVEPALPSALTLAEAEKAHLEKVLALCSGNRTTAARVLGIDRRTLLGKLQRHGLVARGTPTPWGDSSLRER